MKLLLSINSWNSRAAMLTRVLDHYAAEYSDLTVNVVLSTNYAFEYAKLPVTKLAKAYEGYAYCWNNRAYILEHYAEYDYIIDQDDDVTLSRAAFEYYRANEGLPPNYIAGFLTSENGRLITLGSRMVKPLSDPLTLDGKAFVTPRNPHSCLVLIDKTRLTAIAPKLSRMPITVPPRTVAEYARSEVYNVLTKVVSVEAVTSGTALVEHLPCNVMENFLTGRFPRYNELFASKTAAPALTGETKPFTQRLDAIAPKKSPYYTSAPRFAPCGSCGKSK